MKSNGGVSRRKCGTSSSSKAIEESCMPELSEELIFLILTWVPTDVLYNCMRYVCKHWYNLIHSSQFKEQHHPSRGLFFAQDNLGYFSSVGKAEARMINLELPLHFQVWGGCHGLLLLENLMDGTMHIANPLTRRITKIPQYRADLFRHTLSFVCLRSTKEYKVVFTNFSFAQWGYECAVLTLGKGCEWKLIHSQELSDYLRGKVKAYCAGDIVYWVDIHAPHIIGFCVESEATYRLPSPTVDRERCSEFYVSGGEFLSFVVQYEHGKLFDIWRLFDPKGVAGWKKLYKIDLVAPVSSMFLYKTSSLNIPVAWVDKDVLIFKDSPVGPLFGHNVKNGKSIGIAEIINLWSGFYCEFVCNFNWVEL